MPMIADPRCSREVELEYARLMKDQEDRLLVPPPNLDGPSWVPMADRILFRGPGTYLMRTDRGSQDLDDEEK